MSDENKTTRVRPIAKMRARDLRKDATLAERKLWRVLRDKQLNGHRFRRQYPLGDYIVDLVCVERMLIIELDGGQHADQEEYDARRSAWLESQGYKVLRFWNNDVMGNIEGVVAMVAAALERSLLPPFQPSPLKGEGALSELDGPSSLRGKEK